MSRLDFPDLSDPRVAADLDRLARGAAEMERAIADDEAAGRRFATDSAVLAAALAPPPAPLAAPPPPVVVLVVVVDIDDLAPAVPPSRH